MTRFWKVAKTNRAAAGDRRATCAPASTYGSSQQWTTSAPAPSAGTWPLVDIVNLVHEGWFSAPDGFDYEGTALGFNPAKNSLFIASGASLGEIRDDPNPKAFHELRKRVKDLLQITKLYTVFEVYSDEPTAVRSFSII